MAKTQSKKQKAEPKPKPTPQEKGFSDLFFFLDSFHNGTYHECADVFKRRHCFMVNRVFAKIYPTHANALNRNGISQEHVCDFWQSIAKSKMSQYEFKGYMNGSRKAIESKSLSTSEENAEARESIKKHRPEVIDYWHRLNNASLSDFNSMASDFPIMLNEELKKISKLL